MISPIENPHLDDHQKRTMIRMLDGDAPNTFILWHKMGTGKTRLALWAFEYSGFRDLIVVCRRVSFQDWIDEMEKNGLRYLVFTNNYLPTSIVNWGINAKRRMLLISAGDLKNIPIKLPGSKMLVVDELYLFSNPSAKRSQQLQKLSPFCSVCIGLSGTIMPAQDNISIFGQCMALGIHRILAQTKTEFRSKFQTMTNERFGKEYLNKPDSKHKLLQILSPYVDVYFPESRPTTTQIVKVKPHPQQKKAIKELKETYSHEGIDYKYALQVLLVASGISNGWYVDEDKNLQYLESTKIDRLLMLLEELHSAGEKAVIWCAYHNDLERIAEALPQKYEIQCFTAKHKFHPLASWDFCLATEAMGASVNYFKDVKYAIYFSINFKLLDLEQSMGRHERKNSQHDGSHYFFLQTEGTPDVRAYYLVTQSKKSEQEIIKELIKL